MTNNNKKSKDIDVQGAFVVLEILQLIPIGKKNAIPLKHIQEIIEKTFEFNKSNRTYERIMESLLFSKHCENLEYVEKGRGNAHWYYWNEKTTMISYPKISLDMAIALNIVDKILKNILPLNVQGRLKSLFELSNEILSDELDNDLKNWNKKIYFLDSKLSNKIPKINSLILEQALLSLDKQIPLNFKYLKRNGQVKKYYNVYPEGLVLNQGVIYMVAIIEGGEVRNFLMHRIKMILNSSNTKDKPDLEFNLENYIKNEDNAFQWKLFDKKKVELEMHIYSDTIGYFLKESPLTKNDILLHPNKKIKYDYWTFRTYTTLTKQLIGWIRQQGPDIKIINPPELVEFLKKDIKKLNNLYEIVGENDSSSS